MDKEQAAERESAPKPPVAGVIYGRICYWLVMIGILISVIGMIMYFTSGGYFEQQCLLDKLWDGTEVETIWHECAGVESIPGGHWYLSALSHGDVVAMLGIAIIAFAAVVGMWGAFVATARSRDKLYSLFALIAAAILTASAIGVISLE
jgi:hypothetical protein